MDPQQPLPPPPSSFPSADGSLYSPLPTQPFPAKPTPPAPPYSEFNTPAVPQPPVFSQPVASQPQMSAQPVPAQTPTVTPAGMSDVMLQVAQYVGSSNNVLVTVSNNPSVDQLAAAIGLTLILNKLGKHGTAVFSGAIPSTMEFLQPEKTLEKNTDSLQDFIIALDKAKADKLRYKVEDKYVKIFITPYHTSINQKDLEFSQGEVNVDVIIALGVKKQEELDQAIIAHGRILHNATVISINHELGANLGTVNWVEPKTSSLSELVVRLCDTMQAGQTKHLLDRQVATALLTGIVAETNRFSNEETTPETMSTAGILMDAGANQQLIVTKLEAPKLAAAAAAKLGKTPGARATVKPPVVGKPAAPLQAVTSPDGSLRVEHYDSEESNIDKINIDDQGTLSRLKAMAEQSKAEAAVKPAAPSIQSNIHNDDTLHDIEEAVHSPHLTDVPVSQPPAGPGPAADAPAAASSPAPDSSMAPPPVPPPIINPVATTPPSNLTEPDAGVPL